MLTKFPGQLSDFFDFEEEWISLRTSNVIERLNKEFKRRTKPMEIVAGKCLLHPVSFYQHQDGNICGRTL